MPNFTPDFLSDSSKQHSRHRVSSYGKYEMKSPKKSTINSLISFSRALEVHHAKQDHVELILN